MEILEPTVLIVQGRGVRTWLGSVLDGVRPVAANLELARIGRTEVIVASFTHPECALAGELGHGRPPAVLG